MEESDSKFYRIEGTLNLERPIGREESCGFNILLDALFAQELLLKKRTYGFVRNLENKAKEINKSHNFPSMPPYAYFFMDDSVLLRAVFASPHFDIFWDGSEAEYFVNLCERQKNKEIIFQYRDSAGPKYEPHNIDSRRQEVCTFELWNEWYNEALKLFSDAELKNLISSKE
jgi:hypothetical protein